jgi:hypothetical protein
MTISMRLSIVYKKKKAQNLKSSQRTLTYGTKGQ